MTVGDVIAVLKAAVPDMPKEGPLDGSNDTLKVGDEKSEITGIVTTFLATAEVIEKTVALGANLIITHEPTFYYYDDSPETFPGDPVLQRKRKRLEANNITIFRYHDYWHMHRPDGIYTGVVRQMGWQKFLEKPLEPAAKTGSSQGWQDSLEGHSQYVFLLPPTSFRDITKQIKTIFGVESVQLVGDEDALHERVGLFVGSPGPHFQLPAITEHKLDLLICGEVDEWALTEYVRDAQTYGRKLGLIIVGHQPSEEAGTAYLAEWLAPKLPEIPITHIPSGYPLRTA